MNVFRWKLAASVCLGGLFGGIAIGAQTSDDTGAYIIGGLAVVLYLIGLWTIWLDYGGKKE